MFSDTLGLLRSRGGQYLLTAASKAYPRVIRLVTRWMKDSWNECSEQLLCSTSTSINSGYAAKLYRDRINHGPSVCKAIGEFAGGRLGYVSEDNKTLDLLTLRPKHEHEAVFCDVKSGFQVFDGHRGDWAEEFEGDRIGFVFFTLGKY